MECFDCIIIGGGAAGLMCAGVAGNLGKKVFLIEHANRVGKKILMSGGGRCNFTNYYVEPDNYLSQNPHFCKSALSRYTQYDFLELVHGYKLPYHEKAKGQLFCDRKASDILDILLAECQKADALIATQCKILSVEHQPDSLDQRFKVKTTQGVYSCKSLVVASGGLSIPTMGATGFGYELAHQFGLNVTSTAPALVPYTLSGDLKKVCEQLSGVSIPVQVECNHRVFDEDLLFTHRGLSGPAILQMTNYWHSGDSIRLNFLPGQDVKELLLHWQSMGSKKSLKNILSESLPRHFVSLWLERNGFSATQISNMQAVELDGIANAFQNYTLTPGGTEGYRTAEVTRGGVDTDEVSSKTFESKKVAGLFFIGEVLDVTGWLGGFNFQWAWSSGYCAAQYV